MVSRRADKLIILTSGAAHCAGASDKLVWMCAGHPGVLARPPDGASPGDGMRRNVNIDNPQYRRYAQRIIHAQTRHYRDNPHVIG